MKTIKATTKRGQALIESAKRYEGYNLRDVYSSYSYAKRNAWEWCYNQYIKDNGTNFHICSHNSQTFTVAWETDEGVRIETAYNSYLIA